MRSIILLTLLSLNLAVFAFTPSARPCSEKLSPMEVAANDNDLQSMDTSSKQDQTKFAVGDKVLHKDYLNVYWIVSEVMEVSENGHLTICDRSYKGIGWQYSVETAKVKEYKPSQSYTYHKFFAQDLVYNVGDKIRFTSTENPNECSVSKIEKVLSNGYFKIHRPHGRYIEVAQTYHFNSVSTYTDKRWGDDITVRIDDNVVYPYTDKESQLTVKKTSKVLDISSDGYLKIFTGKRADIKDLDNDEQVKCLHISKVSSVR